MGQGPLDMARTTQDSFVEGLNKEIILGMLIQTRDDKAVSLWMRHGDRGEPG